MTGTEVIEHVNVLNALPPQPLKARLWLLRLLLLLLQQTQRSAEPPLETTERVQLAGSSRRINCCYSSADWDRDLQIAPVLCVLGPFLSGWERERVWASLWSHWWEEALFPPLLGMSQTSNEMRTELSSGICCLLPYAMWRETCRWEQKMAQWSRQEMEHCEQKGSLTSQGKVKNNKEWGLEVKNWQIQVKY